MLISPQYLAGFFDGEGSLRLQRGFSRRAPLSIRAEVKITNTNRLILETIHAEYGGKIRVKHNPTRPCYILYWSNMKHIKHLLSLLEPHLVLKRQLAVLMLEFLAKRGGVVRIKTSARDLEIFNQIAVLNSDARYRPTLS
jgi:hypothetical protein